MVSTGLRGALGQVAERRHCRIKQAEADVVSLVINAGHQLHPRRRADRLRVAVLKPHPPPGQTIEVWRRVRLTAVGRDALVAHVVRHDQHDVGLPGGLAARQPGERNNN